MLETDLYEPVKKWLDHHGWEVKGEVKNCDVVAFPRKDIESEHGVQIRPLNELILRKEDSESFIITDCATADFQSDYEVLNNQEEPGVHHDHLPVIENIDLAKSSKDSILIVELKTSLNFEVVLQAVDRQRIGHLVYVAVPFKKKSTTGKRWKLVSHLLKRLELGLLLVHFPHNSDRKEPYIEEVFPPVPFAREKSWDQAKKRRKKLREEFYTRNGTGNKGGSTGKIIMTAYREQTIVIGKLLLNNGPLSTRILRKMGAHEQKTRVILADNYYGWFDRVSVGVYRLSEKGEIEVAKYAE